MSLNVRQQSFPIIIIIIIKNVGLIIVIIKLIYIIGQSDLLKQKRASRIGRSRVGTTSVQSQRIVGGTNYAVLSHYFSNDNMLVE